MTCTCKKCNASIEVDLTSLPEEGKEIKCPACKAHFRLARESFARRALRKGESIFCAQCGSGLGHSIHCPGCRVLFPDYLTSEAGKAAPKKTKHVVAKLKKLPITGERKSSAGGQKSVAGAANPLARILAPVIVIAVVAVLATFFYQQRMEKQYAASFTRSLYLLKGTTELILQKSAQTSADWKARIDAGQSFSPRFGGKDEANLNAGKDNIDKHMLKVNDPPKKFAKAKEKLTHVREVYEKAYALAASPPGSLPAFTEALNATDSEFKAALKDLKADLPEALAEQIKSSKQKYRELRDF